MNKISVVIPAKNEEATLARVLDDLYQTIPRLTGYEVEVICVDDHSTDRTAEIARSFGCLGRRISRADEIEAAVREALEADEPAVIEILVNRELPYTGSPAFGWWDVPVPAYMAERRAQYERERAEEHLT